MKLIELAVSALGDTGSAALLWAVIGVEMLALFTVPSVLLRRRGRPTVAIAWLLSLFSLPLLGSLAWWTFGRTRIEKKKRKRASKKRSFKAQRGSPEPVWGKTKFDSLLPARAQIDSAFSSAGNRLELLGDGPSAFAALELAIADAKRSIHLLYYIYQDDETGRRVAAALIQKARSGVTVRLLLDGFGSQSGTARLRKMLVAGGVQVAIFLPSPLNPLHAPRINFTNHRKIAVLDNCVGFTGGMNVGVEYERHWRDLMIRVEGPAVSALNHVFLEDWYFATDEAVFDPDRAAWEVPRSGSDVAVVASGPDTEAWIHDVYFLAITRAATRVWIVTPYFIPTSPITMALRTAAGRGLDVRIIVPRESDVNLVKWASRSYYRDLITAGVRIFEYTGPMLHAKALVIDEALSAVGSANIDSRSFGLSFEVSCFMDDQRLCTQISDWIAALLPDTVEIDEPWLRNKPLLHKLAESAAHLLSPIL